MPVGDFSRLSNAYDFSFIMNEEVTGEKGHTRNKLFKFKSTKSRLWYIVCVEEYRYDVFAVKFYPKKWQNSPNKYRLLTGTNEPRKIINTCINVMISIFNKDKRASFGFVGANCINEGARETKRFRVYSVIVATYFSDRFFYHKENKEKSAYLLINNSVYKETPDLVKKIEQFFVTLYDF